MEEELKDIIGTNDLEDLFKNILATCTELTKYGALFSTNDIREIYIDKVVNLYTFLMNQCRYFLPDYYRKKIDNIFPEVNESLPKTDEKTVKTVKTVETVETVKTVETEEAEETEEETDEES